MTTININPDGKKMLLSLDGGGMRGVITLGILAELEAMTGKPAYELFDMVAGTSTGAIIAGGLVVHKTAAEILEVYHKKLPPAFGEQDLAFWLRYLLGGLRHLYPMEPFRKVLQPIVEGRKVGACVDPIILLTAKDVRNSNNYFIVSKGPGAAAFFDWPLSGAIAASGSAPIFFPPVQDNLIDGGVGVYGNPCLAAAVEAMEYIGAPEGFTDNNVIHFSLGTGYPLNTRADGAAGRFWLKQWIEYIIGENIDDSGLQQAFVTRAIYRYRMDFRRYNPLLTRQNVIDVLGVDLPSKIDPQTFGLDTHQPQELQIMEAIGRAYARKIDWSQAGVMPWQTIGGHPEPDKSVMAIPWDKTPYK